MRYGIFGGAFDPIHIGHLLLAESCLCRAYLDRVVFVPTGISPHRSGKGIYQASGEDRFNMVELAVTGCEEFLVSRCEIDRQEPSYTIETLRYFKKTFTLVEPELFLLMGADTFNDLPNWCNVHEICRLAMPLVAYRPDAPLPYFDALNSFLPQEYLEKIQNNIIAMPQIEISSTDIRNRIFDGKSIRFQVPKNVEAYIKSHQLYNKKINSDNKSPVS
ncbi:MAG: nicotinate-nucleotide adenylyltransferase [Planctomycetaceae bacterium]|jgi:nicotinate-nucleotide adenylyltransferase|nr:nicotinate-nucleotide adenylyltransferase [Planctomycetaceae bacterium]